jgi:hypothetical protein
MLGEMVFALVRIAFYFFIFYFLYRIVGGFFRGLMGETGRRSTKGQSQQPSPQKPVQKYTDVADAKFEDIPSEKKN